MADRLPERERVLWVVHVDQDGHVVFDFGWITKRDFDIARKTTIPGGHRLAVKGAICRDA